MPNRLFVFPYNIHSESAKLLSEGLDVYRIKRTNSRYRPRLTDVVINWGNVPNIGGVNQLNRTEAVRVAVNKLHALLAMSQAGVSVPRFTTDKNEAARWIQEGEGACTIVCRTILDGHEGAGIVLVNNFLDIPDAPLYTEYVKKKAEYRLHIGRLPDDYYLIIDQTQKVRKRGYEGQRDSRIRNTANGYVFKRNDINVPADVINQAINAVQAIGLDFGAVDVIWNERRRKAYVLEVNTAPGIEGTTVNKYVEYFNRWRQ